MSLMKEELVLITGGAGSIGTAIVKKLAAEGADIVILDFDGAAAEKLACEVVEAYGVQAVGKAFDVADLASHHTIIEEIESTYGPITVLINAAGITSTTLYKNLTPEEYDRMMNINLKGPVFFTKELFFRMKERGKGSVINFASIAGERGAKFAGTDYSISKAGVICFTKILAQLAEDSGVRVNTVSPGLIKSRMSEQVGSKVHSYDVPMNRMGTPEEVADTVLYLASDLSKYITGQNIAVNGGQTMR